MKVLKLISGIFIFLWLLLCLAVTMPISFLLLCYDLGFPRDDKDRFTDFIDAVIEKATFYK